MKVALFSLALSAAVCGQVHIDALGGLDPVLLCSGTEKAGRENLTLEHHRYRYRFSSDATRKAFRADPARYEIQLGGACARMGLLSGEGDASRWHVHDGRIYIFASEGCRKTFIADPDAYLLTPEEFPQGDDAARTSGRELVYRAREALGSREARARIESVRYERRWKQKQGDKVWDRLQRRTFVAPGSFREDTAWGTEYRFATVVTAREGFALGANDSRREMHAIQKDAFRLQLLRRPLLLLGSVTEKTPITAVGPSEVAVRIGGHVTWLTIDVKSGRLLSIRFRGRGPGLKIGRVRVDFSDFREVDGVTIPHRHAVFFNGEKRSESGWDSISFNDVTRKHAERATRD